MKDSKMASRVIFHKPCAYGGIFGATRESCEAMTREGARNLHGCVITNCTCPLRVCKACVTQRERLELVVEPREKGLCAFHKEHGEDARFSDNDAEKPLPGSEDDDATVLVRRTSRAEVIGTTDRFVAMSFDRVALPRTRLGTSTHSRDEPGRMFSLEPKSVTVPAPVAPLASGSEMPQAATPKAYPLLVPRMKPVTRPTRPRITSAHVLEQVGRVKIYDRTKSTFIKMGALDLLALMLKMREDDIPWELIGDMLRLNSSTVRNVRRLARLIPEVRELLSEAREPAKRLGTSSATLIARLRPEYQLQAALAYMAGELTQSRLRDMCNDPENQPDP